VTVDEKIESGRALEALRRKNLEGKKTFIDELKRLQDPRSVSLLLEILCDESWYLRDLALKALVEIDGPAREPLRRILSGGLWYTRAAAARALGRMGDAASARDLLDLLDDSNRTVREAGVEAILAMAAAGQVSALGRAIAQMPPERRYPRQSQLERIDPDLAKAVEAAAGGPGGTPDDAPADPAPTRVADAPRSAGAPRATESATPSDEAPQDRESTSPVVMDLFHGEGGNPPGRP
jgi:hypothetical protein